MIQSNNPLLLKMEKLLMMFPKKISKQSKVLYSLFLFQFLFFFPFRSIKVFCAYSSKLSSLIGNLFFKKLMFFEFLDEFFERSHAKLYSDDISICECKKIPGVKGCDSHCINKYETFFENFFSLFF